jgi:hypothetical protein
LWIDEFGKNKVEFVKNEAGEVIQMMIYKNVLLTKLKGVSHEIQSASF